MIRIEQLLAKVLGLNVASIGNSAVQRSVQDRIEACSVPTIDEYWKRLNNNSDELQELIERIVVPETWFFRNPEAMYVLKDVFTKEWPANRASEMRRVLSVPCATGEEPYSIAITLKEAGLKRDQVMIDAIDISHRSLTKAERGVYGSNSFRGEAVRVRDKYFTTGPRGVAELDPEIKKWVRFTQANIISANFTTPLKSYDAIFCRNLLIYLDNESQRHVMQTIRHLLTPDGFLFLGPAEAPLALEHGFTPMGHDMSFAYRKGEAHPRVVHAIAPKLLEKHKVPAKEHKHKTPLRLESKEKSKAALQGIDRRAEPRTTAPENDLDRAFRLADAGQLKEAADACQSYLSKHGTSATAFYLLGILRDAMGDLEGAVGSYRKALFLDPNHADASAHLSMLARRLGDVEGAERLSARSRRSANTNRPVR